MGKQGNPASTYLHTRRAGHRHILGRELNGTALHHTTHQPHTWVGPITQTRCALTNADGSTMCAPDALPAAVCRVRCSEPVTMTGAAKDSLSVEAADHAYVRPLMACTMDETDTRASTNSTTTVRLAPNPGDTRHTTEDTLVWLGTNGKVNCTGLRSSGPAVTLMAVNAPPVVAMSICNAHVDMFEARGQVHTSTNT